MSDYEQNGCVTCSLGNDIDTASTKAVMIEISGDGSVTAYERRAANVGAAGRAT